jgi:hypothetical protein
MENVQVDLGNWIQDGFDLYKRNFGVLVLASLIAILLAGATFFILAGPMSAGIIFITLKAQENKAEKAEVGDLFKGFGFFVQSLLFIVVFGIIILAGSAILGILPLIGTPASICFQVAVNALLMFALFLIVDKQMDFWTASMESINMVKTNFWPFLVLSLIAGVLGSIGAIIIGIGIVFTLPIYFCIITVAYRKVY